MAEADPDISRNGTFREDLIKQIQQEFSASKTIDAFNAAAPKPPKPFTLEQILGPQSANHWWRLYIDPKDWEKAQKLHDPGHLYDEPDQVSKGWQKAMNAVYTTYLSAGAKEHIIADKPMTWPAYLKLWHLASDGVGHEKNAPYGDRVTRTEFGKYGTPFPIAQDVIDDVIRGEPLVEEVFDKTKTPWVVHTRNSPEMTAFVSGEPLLHAVEEVFAVFQTAIAAAKTRAEQLKTIAKAVRRLHVLHTFYNGCGRVNVQTILPAMLLHYGFGLPLGGEHGRKIHAWAQYYIFNGGFEDETIAMFLWLRQDFGLADPHHHSILSGGAPAPSGGHSGASPAVPIPNPTHGGASGPSNPPHGGSGPTNPPTGHPSGTQVKTNVKIVQPKTSRPVSLSHINGSGAMILH